MTYEARKLRIELQATLRGEHDDRVAELAAALCKVIPLQRSLRVATRANDQVAIGSITYRLGEVIDGIEASFAGMLHEGNFYQQLMDSRLAVEAGREDAWLGRLREVANGSDEDEEGSEP